MRLWELAYLVKEIRARLGDPLADCDFRPCKSDLILSVWQNVNLTEQRGTKRFLLTKHHFPKVFDEERFQWR
jgi:hypothetical protein